MPAPPLPKRTLGRWFASALIVAVTAAVVLRAGPLPNLLDDNRGNIALTAVENAAFNTRLPCSRRSS